MTNDKDPDGMKTKSTRIEKESREKKMQGLEF